MKAVILAGGIGERLKPFTEIIPKPLLPIGDKAILEIQIERLRQHGCDEILLATNYKSDYIEHFLGDGSRYGVRITVNSEAKPLGTAGPLSLLADRLTEPFIVMNGDILTLLDFRRFHEFALRSGSLLTLAIKKEITPFAFGNILFEGDRVTGIEEKPNIVMHILCGIYVMKPEILRFIPRDEYFGMDQLIKRLLAERISISKYEMNEYWLDIGRADSYQMAQASFHKEIGSGGTHG